MDPEKLFKDCADAADSAARERAAAEFRRRYEPLIRATLTRMLRAPHARAEIDDLVQNTFVRFWKNGCRALLAFEYTGPGSDFSYVKTIAASEAKDYFKRKSIPIPSEIPPDALTAAPAAERNLYLREAEDSLNAVCGSTANYKRNRKIFLLHHRIGLTAKEISQRAGIGLTPKGVEAVLQKTMVLIRSRLQLNKKKAKNESTDSRTAEESA